MDLPSKHALNLSRKLGSRGPGSDIESAAASYILHSMSDISENVNMETFSCWKSDWNGISLVCVLGLLSFALYLTSYLASVLLSVFSVLIFQMETYSWAVFSRISPRSPASNIFCRIKPKDEIRRRVVLVANYDTPKSSIFGRSKLSRAFRAFYFLSFISFLVITGLALFGFLGSLAEIHRKFLLCAWLSCCPLAFYLLIFTLAIVSTEIFGDYTAGANDNASGVGVMLSVLAAISSNPLEYTEVWGLASARAYAGGRGMVAFLGRHRRQLKDAFIINIDHPGRDKLSVVTREGTILGFRPSRKLLRLVKKVSGSVKGLNLSKAKCRVKKSDAMVALARGYKAITIGGFSGGTFTGWRNTDDVFDHLDRISLDKTVKFIQLLLEEIDSSF